MNTIDRIIISYNNDHKDNYDNDLFNFMFDKKDILNYLFDENEIINRCVRISTCVSENKDHESIAKGILDFFNGSRYICNVQKEDLYILLNKYGVIWLNIDTMKIVTDEKKIDLLNMLR